MCCGFKLIMPMRLSVHFVFLSQEGVLFLAEVRIIHAAVDRTNRSALRLIVEAYALGAFVGDDIVNVHSAGSLSGIRIDL